MPSWNARSSLDRSLRALPVGKLARSSGFRRRKPRKIGAWLFLKAMCLLALRPAPSLSLAAVLTTLMGKKIVSRQGVWKRFGPASAAFVRGVTEALMAVKSDARRLAQAGVFGPFRRVLIEDSTVVPLAASLAKAYPGGANQSGKKNAAAKVHTVYDLLAGSFLRFGIFPFTRNDQAAAPDILSLARKGDLLLRDLGFFVLSVFRRMNGQGVSFLSRLRQNVWIGDLEGNRFDLLGHLRRHGTFDAEVLLGKQEKLRVRLVAVPVSDAAAQERRRRLRQNRDKRLRPTGERLALLGWALMITNVSAQIWDAPTVCNVYRVRWRIEILFKAWKSHFRLAALPHGSRGYVETLLWARLLLVMLLCTIFQEPFSRSDRRPKPMLSFLKTARFLLLCLTHAWMPRLDLAPARLSQILRRLCAYDQRKDRHCFPQFVHLLG